MKILFIPVSIIGGLHHRDIEWGKLIVAAAIQGAIFRAVKEATDHYSRRAFAGMTGTWPGEERPEPE